jgi:hypothetical protein
MAQMLQHSWLKCYNTIAVIKLTKVTSHFPPEKTVSWFGSLLALPLSPNPAIFPLNKPQ